MQKTGRTFVYFIKCNEFVKIGYSYLPSDRLINIQAGNPYACTIVALICQKSKEEAMSLEADLHDRFSDHKERGEWYRYDSELKSFVYDITLRGRL